MKYKFFYKCLFLLFISHAGFSQTGYSIRMVVNGLKDTTVYLGYRYGELTYIRDTAIVNSKGEFSFEGKKPLDQGPYFLVMNNAIQFDFVVGANQHFALQTSNSDYLLKMSVKND